MINIAVLFGGTSVEHEVSIITALQAINTIKKMNGYRPVPIYVSKQGRWFTGHGFDDIENYKNIPRLLAGGLEVILERGSIDGTAALFALDDITASKPGGASKKKALAAKAYSQGESAGVSKRELKQILRQSREMLYTDDGRIDIVFPIIHGTSGEDGTLQGKLELINVPYIGCGPLASAVTMDKTATKALLKNIRVPQMPGKLFYSDAIETHLNMVVAACERDLEYPMIVKPADIGSSVGVYSAHSTEELKDALKKSSKFSTKVIVEYKLEGNFEINISVLGDRVEQKLSVCEHPLSDSEFLTYEDKYQQQGGSSKGMSSAKREIPADIPEELRKQIELLARQSFVFLDCAGVVRIDFLVDKDTMKPYLCELNTIPGSLSFYLWEATGLDFEGLIRELIKIAYRVHRRNNRKIKSIDSNLLDQGSLLGIKK